MFLVKDLMIDWRLGRRSAVVHYLVLALEVLNVILIDDYSTSANICLMLTSRLITEGGNPPSLPFFFER